MRRARENHPGSNASSSSLKQALVNLQESQHGTGLELQTSHPHLSNLWAMHRGLTLTCGSPYLQGYQCRCHFSG
jgi:hypothetical protein